MIHGRFGVDSVVEISHRGDHTDLRGFMPDLGFLSEVYANFMEEKTVNKRGAWEWIASFWPVIASFSE
ncbi:hypothetical protein ATG71_0520 [Bacillus sp. es.034]|nr:hypothetical protein ATG71_0520 [Bacillus sp. es.034]